MQGTVLSALTYIISWSPQQIQSSLLVFLLGGIEVKRDLIALNPVFIKQYIPGFRKLPSSESNIILKTWLTNQGNLLAT